VVVPNTKRSNNDGQWITAFCILRSKKYAINGKAKMEIIVITETPLYTWIVLPILIMIARIIDVSIGTLRIIFIAKRRILLAPVLGFFEVLIWLLAIEQIFKNLSNIACYLAYAGGFGLGNYIGMILEKRLALGLEMIRIITKSHSIELIKQLKKCGNGLTIVDGQGSTGPVKIIFSVVPRKKMKEMIALVNSVEPSAYYTIENIESAREIVTPIPDMRKNNLYRQMYKMDRKRK
jgi:uncharacterized protein YebE (UPF0316 family)